MGMPLVEEPFQREQVEEERIQVQVQVQELELELKVEILRRRSPAGQPPEQARVGLLQVCHSPNALMHRTPHHTGHSEPSRRKFEVGRGPP